MNHNSWLLIFSIFCILFGIGVFLKGIKSKEKTHESFDPAVSDIDDLVNPFTWIFAWIGKKMPLWFCGIPPVLFGIYLLFRYLKV